MGANKRLRQCSQGRRWESALSFKLRSRVKRTGPNRSRATGEFMDQKKTQSQTVYRRPKKRRETD